MNLHENCGGTLSDVCSTLKESYSDLDQLKSRVFELSMKRSTSSDVECQALETHLVDLHHNILDINKKLKECQVITNLCFRDLAPRISWLPPSKKHLQMTYLDGNTPWEIWFTYQDMTQFKSLSELLENVSIRSGLKPFFGCPDVGMFVLCFDRKFIFRGMVVSVLKDGRLKIINVDRNCVKIIKRENVYQINEDLCRHHSLAIKCCLLKDETTKKNWDDELSSLFTTTLKECQLEVNVLEEVPGLPPKFLIEICGYNKNINAYSNIGEWITNNLLPEIVNLSKNGILEDMISFLAEEALDPYGSHFKTAGGKETEWSDQDRLELGKSFVSNSINQIKPNLPKLIPNLPNDPSGPNETDLQLTKNFVQKKGQKNTYKHCGVMETSKVPQTSSRVEKSLNDFSPYVPNINPQVLTGGNIDDDSFEGIDACITNGYEPKDELENCFMFSKHGYCKKLGCIKKHVKDDANLWTTDKVSTYYATFNRLTLPKESEILDLSVTEIRSPTSFYAQLPTKYTAMSDNESDETLETLMDSLQNNFKNFKYIDTELCTGEMVLAYIIDDRLWYRARVLENLNIPDSYSVFLIDYGDAIVVSLKHLRQIPVEYLHLPEQAVLCFLDDLDALDDSKIKAEGEIFLKKLIHKKIIKAHVSRVLNEALYVVALINKVDINEIMIKNSFCR